MIKLLFQISVWQWFQKMSWNDVLTVIVLAGAVASTVAPFLDAGSFRFILLVFIAVSVKLQNLGNSQEIKRLRVMLGDLSAQADTIAATQPTTPQLDQPKL